MSRTSPAGVWMVIGDAPGWDARRRIHIHGTTLEHDVGG